MLAQRNGPVHDQIFYGCMRTQSQAPAQFHRKDDAGAHHQRTDDAGCFHSHTPIVWIFRFWFHFILEF